MSCEETIINNTRVKLVNGHVFCFIKWRSSKNVNDLNWYKFNGTINKQTGYKTIKINKKCYYYHRVIYKLNNPEWDITDNCCNNSIDHIDHNKLNNNIENLRCVTHQHNLWNRAHAKGYSWNKKDSRWRAKITVNGKTKSLGTFINEEDARNAYLDAKIKYHVIKNAYDTQEVQKEEQKICC